MNVESSIMEALTVTFATSRTSGMSFPLQFSCGCSCGTWCFIFRQVQARALEVYAMQAKNTEAETKVCEIRLRAERRADQMLAGMEKATGARGNPNGQGAPIVPSRDGSTQKPLNEHGISGNQSSRWQKLAANAKQARAHELRRERAACVAAWVKPA